MLFRQLLFVSVLSGLCVASCFLVLGMVPGETVVHAVVYAAILTLATLAGTRMTHTAASFPALHSPARGVLDVIAGVGLAIIGFGPLTREWLGIATHQILPQEWGAGVAGLAYLLLTASTYRHLPQYRGLASVMTSIGQRRLARTLRALGVTKFLFESVWLACCALPLLGFGWREILGHFRVGPGYSDLLIWPAFGALFGLPVFAVIWIVMMAVHGRCLVVVGRAATLGERALPGTGIVGVGFDVLPLEAEPSRS